MPCWAGKANHNCPAEFLQPIYRTVLPVLCMIKLPLLTDHRELDSGPMTSDPFHDTHTSFAPVSDKWNLDLTVSVGKLFSRSFSSPPSKILLRRSYSCYCQSHQPLCTCWLCTAMFKAVITPLLKMPGLDSKALKNYSPVSNLPYLSKLLERVVLHQLVEHVMNNDLEQKQSAQH